MGVVGQAWRLSSINKALTSTDKIITMNYKKSTSMYVSKFICDDKIDYGFVKK